MLVNSVPLVPPHPLSLGFWARPASCPYPVTLPSLHRPSEKNRLRGLAENTHFFHTFKYLTRRFRKRDPSAGVGRSYRTADQQWCNRNRLGTFFVGIPRSPTCEKLRSVPPIGVREKKPELFFDVLGGKRG